MINNNDITIVLQGSTLSEFEGKRCIEYSVSSIRKILPDCKIILSTWEGEEIPEYIEKQVDKIIYNKDPGFRTRDCKPDGKPNNVNRQIVSTINGLKQVETKYAMKMRTDFVLMGKGFLKYFDKYQKFDQDFQIFEKRVICIMLGSAHPYGKYWNLPFHVSDFCTFGLTTDLTNLYDIPLVTSEEFEWFIKHTEFMPNTYARNKYDAEQSIWINCLTKNGVKVKCEYSTHINDEIAEQSDKCLANNFVPVAFSKFGIQPIKQGLKSKNWIKFYTEYFTQKEWLQIYKKYCDKSIKYSKFDYERFIINLAICITENKYPKILKSIMRRIITWSI